MYYFDNVFSSKRFFGKKKERREKKKSQFQKYIYKKKGEKKIKNKVKRQSDLAQIAIFFIFLVGFFLSFFNSWFVDVLECVVLLSLNTKLVTVWKVLESGCRKFRREIYTL